MNYYDYECGHFVLELDSCGTQYFCHECDRKFRLDEVNVVRTKGSDTCVNTQQERGDTMNTFDTSSLNTNTVSRNEAGAWIARQAEEQGIGNSFKVYYDGAIMGKLEDLPEQVDLDKLRVSAALDQAGIDTWFVLNQHAHALAECK